MTKSNSAMDLRDSTGAGLTAKRRAPGRRAGTTLVEILVVIVIFLIGILAVVQVFPGGFRLLITTRNNSVATALGRSMVEQLKSNPEQIPDEIVHVRYSGGVPVADTTVNPLGLEPLGNTISAGGVLKRGGVDVAKDWKLAAGPNVARHIVGEGSRLPAPRLIGALTTGAGRFESYGSLMVLAHGPVDPGNPDDPTDKTYPHIVAYANDLSRTLGAPRDTAYANEVNPPAATDIAVSLVTQDRNGGAVSFPGTKIYTPVSLAPYEFFVVRAGTPTAAILVPANHGVARTYRVRMSAYVGKTGDFRRYDYIALSVTVPAIAEKDVNLVEVPLAPLLADTDEIKVSGGQIMAAVEPETVRVAPKYIDVNNDPNRPASLKGVWSTPQNTGTVAQHPGVDVNAPIDPFEMKIQDPVLGVLMFSPAGREGVVSRPGGTSEPLMARVDYDVRDWRIISEDFRVVGTDGAFTLSLQSLKVGSNVGPDGRANMSMFGDNNAWDPYPSPRDNVVLVDLTTGYEVQRALAPTVTNGRTPADLAQGEVDPGNVFVQVDKSRGSIVLRDSSVQTPGLNVRLIPPTGAPITVDAANRTFRVLYRARQEWAVQVLKGASQYTLVNTPPSLLAPDQAYIAPGNTARINFPISEVGRKVTIDRLAYRDRDSGAEGLLEGQDFILQAPKANDPSGFAYADITQILPNQVLSYKYGVPVRGIKGASVTVRVLWNPDTFFLDSSDLTLNHDRAVQWGRGWRKSLTETYLRAEEAR